jgi:prepilin-type N-terminal cleavage/methylation domain-containing protein
MFHLHKIYLLIFLFMFTSTTHNRPQGFTLVELIIVVSIIAVLSSLAFMSLSGETAQARDSKRVADIKTFEDSIATSNGKNKKIDFTNNPELGAVQDTSITTTSGALFPLRGAYLIQIKNGLFDSDVLPTIPRDPKGAPYLASFLSKTEYQIFGTLENPDTKTETAVARGSFKAGAIIDVLIADTDDSSLTFSVANSRRFVAGDVIKIDNEEMTVATFIYYPTTKVSTVTVAARGGTPKVHNKGASIKLKTPVEGTNSLLCLGAIYSAEGTPVLVDTTTLWATYMTSDDAADAITGVRCGDDTATATTIINDSENLPFQVTAE